MGSRLELSVVPRFPARQLCGQEALKRFVQESWTPWRGMMFPDPGSSILSQHESAIVLAPVKGLSMFDVNVWGLLFYVTKIDDEHIVSITLGVRLPPRAPVFSNGVFSSAIDFYFFAS